MPKNEGIYGEGLGTGLPNDGDYSDAELNVLSYLADNPFTIEDKNT